MKITKKQSKIFLAEISHSLVQRYGFSHYFSWQQVYKTVEEGFPKQLAEVQFAYALFCTKDDFLELTSMCNFSYTYDEIREAFKVPSDNELEPFWKSNSSSIKGITVDTPNANAMSYARANGV